MASRENNDNVTKPKVPYTRPSRKNQKQISWTYEMKTELYECYRKSEANIPGYMNRLKVIWDDKHPEYTSLSAKNLRDKVAWIIKKKDIAILRMEPDSTVDQSSSDDMTNQETPKPSIPDKDRPKNLAE